MKYFIAVFLSFLLSLSSLAYAQGIDLKLAPEVQLVESSGPFYAKADLGMTFSDFSIQADKGASASNPQSTQAFLADIGLGYQYNDLLRFDATIAYRGKSKTSGIILDNAEINGSKIDGNVSSITAMANAYIDIATIKNITPYIGVGIGASQNSISNMRFANTYIADKAQIDFAWALHLGFAWHLNNNLALDFGYNYTDLGNAPLTTAHGVSLDNLVAHDIKIGLRYKFN